MSNANLYNKFNAGNYFENYWSSNGVHIKTRFQLKEDSRYIPLYLSRVIDNIPIEEEVSKISYFDMEQYRNVRRTRMYNRQQIFPNFSKVISTFSGNSLTQFKYFEKNTNKYIFNNGVFIKIVKDLKLVPIILICIDKEFDNLNTDNNFEYIGQPDLIAFFDKEAIKDFKEDIIVKRMVDLQFEKCLALNIPICFKNGIFNEIYKSVDRKEFKSIKDLKYKATQLFLSTINKEKQDDIF